MMRWFGSIIKIKLADLGEGTKGATIKEFFVKEGTKIKEVNYIIYNCLNFIYSMMIFVKYLQIN